MAPLHRDTTRPNRPLRLAATPRRSPPFYLGQRIDHPHHAGLALAVRRPRRAPGARLLIGTARVAQDLRDGARLWGRADLPLRRAFEGAQRPRRRAVPLAVRRPLGQRHHLGARRGVVGLLRPAPRRNGQHPQATGIEAFDQGLHRAATGVPRGPCRRREAGPRRHREQGCRPLHRVVPSARRLLHAHQPRPFRLRQRPYAFLLPWCHRHLPPWHQSPLPDPHQQLYAA